MIRTVVLACAHQDIVQRVTSVATELGDNLVQVTATSADTLDAVAARRPDVLVVHDRLGPVPVLDLIRQVARLDPRVGVLLLSSSVDPEDYRMAMEAGARSVAPVGFTVDDLGQRIAVAADWSRTVREHLAGEAARAAGSGHVVVLAGSKGGVGTTTIAVHTALEAAVSGRRACLVDLDLQGGDVAALLDISHRRDVVDLVGVAGEITAQSLDDTLYRHASGLDVLIAPREGERGEEVTDQVARSILGALKSRFDVVVVDVGSVLTMAGAAAVELADRVSVVATPDVLSMRGARRAVTLWERLELRRENDVQVLLNRVSRAVEVQPDLAAKLARLRVSEAAVPAAFRAFEAAANAGDPGRVVDREARRALARVAHDLGARDAAVAAPDSPNGSKRNGSRKRRGRGDGGAAAGANGGRGDAGQTAVEFMGLVPVIGVILLGLLQGAAIGYGHVLAGHAAAEAARTAVSPLNGYAEIAAAAQEDLPGPWRREVQVLVAGQQGFGAGDPRYADPNAEVTVRLRAPAVVPLMDDLFGDGLLVRSTAQMRFEGR